VCKALQVKPTSYISGLLKAKPDGRFSLRSDSQDLLAVPRTISKTLGDRAFAKVGPPCGMSFPLIFAERHQWRLSKAS